MSTKRRQKQLAAINARRAKKNSPAGSVKRLDDPWFVTVSPRRAVTGSSTVESRNHKCLHAARDITNDYLSSLPSHMGH